MNELDELSSLRADMPAGDGQDLTRPRELLWAEIRASRDSLARHRARPGSGRRPRGRTFPRHLPGTRQARSPRVRALLVGGAALAAVLAVSAALLSGPGQQVARGRVTQGIAHPVGNTDVTAAYVLDRAAATVAGAHWPAPRPGEYISMSSIATGMGAEDGTGGQITRSWLTTTDRQIWLPVSGRGVGALRIVVRQKQERLPWGGTPPDLPSRHVMWMTVPASTCPASTQGTYPYLTSLPTRPSRLRAWIYAHLDGGKLPANYQAWKKIMYLLNAMPVPPKLAAALLRVAATIPGATVVRDVTDAAGRDGVAVARLVPGQASAELIFDPASYTFLGERTVLAAPVPGVGPAGTVVSLTANLNVTLARHLPHYTATNRHYTATSGKGGASAQGC